jgi:glycosyltransferase involved in cell wall biosynthesis
VISIVVPAHNESAVIGRLLESVTAGALPGEFDIVVVCNGCTDDTAEVVRRYAPFVRVVETSVASKTHALNCGDQVCRGFPRFYVDADVVVTVEVLRVLAERLNKGDVLAIAPRARLDVTNSSLAVRSFYKIQRRLPSSNEGIGGSGIYGLSEVGRRRFGKFPDITADDGYVRIHFRPDERETLGEVHSIVFAPHTIKNLIAIKSRSHFGNFELAKRYPQLWPNKGVSNHRSLLRLLLRPWLWPGLLVYGSVTVLARWEAKRRLRRKENVWPRDDSSRVEPLRAMEKP